MLTKALALIVAVSAVLGYEHREFAILHHFHTTIHDVNDTHLAMIPLEFMWEAYNRSIIRGARNESSVFVHENTEYNRSEHHHHQIHMPVVYPESLSSVSPSPVYSEEFVNRIATEADTYLVNPQGVETVDNGAVVVMGWPGLSQSGEDLYAFDKWFFGMTHGVILESGALNGMTFSNSWFFEYFANWTCIHVEADQKSFRQLTRLRPRAVNIHAALCSTPAELHYVDSSLPISGIYEFMEPEFLKRWHFDLYEHPAKAADLPVIHCVPPKLLFAALAITRVDIWVLDVEGAELDVLKGVDWTQVEIKSIIMECDGTDREAKDEKKMELLAKVGFNCSKVALISACMCKHDLLNVSSGGTFDGYPFSVSKGGHELFLMHKGKVRSFSNMDDYDYFTDHCGPKAQRRKEVKKVYFQTHPRGAAITRPELEVLCGRMGTS